jgi:hypothetical protein
MPMNQKNTTKNKKAVSAIPFKPYRARGVVLAPKKPGALKSNQPFPPVPKEDLVYRGGRTWANMSYKTFYLGKAWTDPGRATDRTNLDAALAAAMSAPP